MFVKRYVTRDNDEHLDVDISQLLSTSTGKKIYGKFINCSSSFAFAWLQGVVDTVQIANLHIPGLSSFWDDVCGYGVDAVRQATLK